MKKIYKQLKEKTVGELKKEEHTLREELAKGKMSWTINPPKDTNILSKKRKKLAVVLTMLTEKKDTEQLQEKKTKSLKK